MQQHEYESCGPSSIELSLLGHGMQYIEQFLTNMLESQVLAGSVISPSYKCLVGI